MSNQEKVEAEAAYEPPCGAPHQHREPGMVRACTLPVGHEGQHEHHARPGSPGEPRGPRSTAGGPPEPRSSTGPTPTTPQGSPSPTGAPEANFWQPIETAPKDAGAMLYLARFDEQGILGEIDFDGCWAWISDEHPLDGFYGWTSAYGRVEEPTHWAYQVGPPPPVPGDKP